MTDKTDIEALRPSERAKLGFVTDDNTGGYYVAECEECGKIFPSQNAEGGGPIADSGDYDDCYCPHCGHVDPEECDNANLVWNVQQLKIITLTSQLEAERQRANESGERFYKAVQYGAKLEAELAELRGEQEPVADIIRDANRYRFLRDEDSWGEDSDSWDFETKTGLISSQNLMGGLSPKMFDAAVDARLAASDIPFLNPVRGLFTSQPKPVVVLPRLTVGEVMHRSGFDRQYAEGWVSANDWAINELKLAGIVVKDGE